MKSFSSKTKKIELTKIFSSVGCWKRSAGAITATAILMLTACLLASGAMGLWHTVEFFEKEKVVGEEYFQQWPNVVFFKRYLSKRSLLITKIICRFCVTIREFPMTGLTLWHGLLLLVNLLQQFFCRAQQFAFEVNARKRNNSIYNISCQFIHKSNLHMVTHIHKHKSIQDLITMDLNMDLTTIE